MTKEMLLYVVLVSSLLSKANAQGGVTSGYFCPILSAAAGKGHDTHLTFLQQPPLGNVVLYTAVWTEDNQLVRCSVNSDPSITEEYLALCKNKPDVQTDAAIRRVNVSTLLSPDNNPCTPDVARDPLFVGQTTQHEDEWDPASRTSEAKSRRKRAWFFPGTLWCGTGSSANEYNQLGMFESADKCCREHDHCVHIIPSFTVNYGTLNTNLFTVSHCDCDQRFQQCLLGVNDTISDIVGYTFFNILKVPCFNLIQKKQCSEMSWWGRCKVSKEAPYAIFQNSLSYITSVFTSTPAAASGQGDNSTCTEGCAPTDPKRRPNIKHTDTSDPTLLRCRPREPPRGDTFQPRWRKGKACRKSRKQHAMSSDPMRQATRAVRSTPATSFPNRPRVAAELRPTRVVSGALIRSGNKKNAGGLGVMRASLATPKAITAAATSSTASAPPVSRTTAFDPPVGVATQTAVNAGRHAHAQKKQRRRSPGVAVVVRGGSSRQWREPCLEKTAAPDETATTAPSTVESGLPRQLKTVEKQRPDRRAAAAASTTPQETTSGLSVRIPVIKMSGILTGTADTFWDVGNSPRHSNKAKTEPSLTGNLAHCTVLKILDECKYRIPALQKKFGLQNMETKKTVYHCDCINRLTINIKPTKIVLSLLEDFVSGRCFDLPTQKKCLNRKRCIGYFAQAPAAFQGLEQNVEKDTAAKKNVLQYTKIVIPVRLYKRCLRTVAPGIS